MGVQLDQDTLGADVRRLLLAYSDTLDVLERLPRFPMVAVGWHWRWPRGAPLRLPRLSLTAYSQTVRHIDRVLAAAERSLLRREALGAGGDDDADALAAVRAFRASLPSRSWVLRASVLVLAVFVVARALAGLAPSFDSIFSVLPHVSKSSVSSVFDRTLGVLDPGSSSVGSAIDGLFSASLATLAVGAVLLVVAAYLVLRPAMSAFRLKRLAFNLYPHADSALHKVPASWSVSRASGVYALERDAFAALGARVPTEIPLDVIVPVPAAVAFVGVVAALIATNEEPESSALGDVIAALLYCGPGLFRIAWLAAVWRARRGDHRSWLLASDVAVPWSSRPVRCRSPAMIGYMALMSFFTFPVVVCVWWSTSADLRRLGRAHKVKRLEKLRPLEDSIVVVLYFMPFSPLWRALGRVRAAQLAIGLERPVSRWLLILLPAPPLLLIELQRQLNRLWEAEGTCLDTSEAIAAQMHPLTPPELAA